MLSLLVLIYFCFSNLFLALIYVVLFRYYCHVGFLILSFKLQDLFILLY